MARLIADIPVELKRKIATYTKLHGYGIKDIIIKTAEAHRSKFSPEEWKLIDTILEQQWGMLSQAA